MTEEQPRHNLRLPPIVRYAGAAMAFLIPTAWLSTYGVCMSWEARLCGWSGLYPFVTVATAALTLAPIGLAYLERAQKRARKGMYARPGPASGGAMDWGVRTFKSVSEVLWDDKGALAWGEGPGPEGLITGEMRYEARGWWLMVEVNGGTRVWVDRWRFWQWLEKVERLHHTVGPGESAIGERRWAKLGRPLWMAYVDILEAVGAVEYPTGDARSRRYVPGLPWGRVEEYEKLRPSEARW